MYLMYVDESGDTGLTNSPTDYFVLSGLIIHELAWHQTIDSIIAFRRQLRAQYGLKLREELHASECIKSPGRLARIRKDLRLRMLRDVLVFQAGLSDVSILNVLIDKTTKKPDFDVFDVAWTYLLQRFHNTISHRNFPGPRNAQDFGLVVCDQTDEARLRKLTRKVQRFNPVPNMLAPGSRQVLMKTLVEDSVHRDSGHSLAVQLVDTNAYFLHQKQKPNAYVRKKGARNFFDLLEPVLCKHASRIDPQGVVRA